MNDNLQTGFRIGDWTVYPQENLLKAPDREHVLEPKVMDVLVFLAGRCGDVVSRQQLLDSVWTNVVVGDETLSRAVSVLRAELGDDVKNPRYLQTISKRGYRLIAQVVPLDSNEPKEADSISAAARATSAERSSDSLHGLRRREYRFAIIGLIAVVTGGLVLGFFGLETTPDQKIMLAVLPLDNLSGDPEQEYFSDGLTEEMIAQLASLQRHRLGVIARTSVMYYKDKNKRIDQIARELNVDYVLEGSVRRTENRVRITAQLIKVSDQTHLWAQTFERDVDDIFALQIEVAERVVRSLALELLPAERAQLHRTSPVSSAAYEAYLKGRYHDSRGGRNGGLKAIEHYHEAILEDPDYALAYAAVGHAYGVRGMLGYIPFSEGNSKFWDYNLKAAELNPGLAEVEVNFADFKFYGDWNWSDGETGFRRAFEKDPDSENVVWHYALCLHLLGRYEEASGVLEGALRLDPFSRQLNGNLIDVYLDSRQYDRAIALYQRMIEWEPNDAGIYNSYGNALADMGRDDDAVEVYLQARSLAGDSTDRVQALRNAYMASGLRGYWQKRVEHLTADRRRPAACGLCSPLRRPRKGPSSAHVAERSCGARLRLASHLCEYLHPPR